MKQLFDRHIKRMLYLILGSVFFVTGLIGVFLPVLPTTPFMLLALWAFSNSSQHLHDYIWHHKKYGPMVRAWKKFGAIPFKAKVSSVTVMGTSAVIIVFFTSTPTYGVVAALSLMLAGAIFILSRPTLRLEQQQNSESP